MDTRSNQSNPFTGFTSRKGERPSTPGYDSQPQSAPLNMSAFQKPQGVQTPFGSMPNLQTYQNQQDAFVQQFLQNQAQYNQGLMGGQMPQRVDLGTTWNQAAENIKDGRYQGNPFATGNVDALMGMFGQYGITPPQGFQDQLINQLGQQSAPPMYGPGMPSSQPPAAFAPGYGGSINAPPGSMRTMDFRDRDGDKIDDRDQPGPGMPRPGSAQPVPPSQQLPPGRMADWGGRQYDPPGRPAMDTPPAAQPNPSDPWSYPLRPGMRRGPDGEQIMTEEARQAEIKRREQETGMRYVQPRAPGQTGSWLPAPKPASQNRDQSAAMAEYIRTQATPGRARPTPTRTQGTRRR
jgi:hypothetical protein